MTDEAFFNLVQMVMWGVAIFFIALTFKSFN